MTDINIIFNDESIILQFSVSQNLSFAGKFEVLQAKGRTLISTILLLKLGSSNVLLPLFFVLPRL